MGNNQLKLQNALRLGNLASAPSPAAAGLMYWDTVLSKLRVHNGSAFVSVADLTVLGSTTDGSAGADLVGGENKSYSNISGLTTYTVQDFIDRIDSALGSAGGSTFSDSVFRIQDNGDATKQIAFEASGITTGTTRTITMPDSNVNLGLVGTAIQRDGSVTFTANQPMGGFKFTGLGAGSTSGDSVRYEQVILRDGSNAFTADQSLGGFKLTNVATPTSGTDAANKNYVDNAVNGLYWKSPVRVASTANVNISNGLENGDSLDGVTLATGDRVLLKDQTAPAENGIYVVVASGAASRSADMDAWSEVPSSAVFVQEGTANADKGFVCTSDAGGTLGTTTITFVQFSSAGSFVEGDGIDIVGSTISVDHDGQGLQFVSNELALELDGSTLSKSASGIKVADAGITGTQLAASVAGNGLAGGAGSALSVNVDDSTIEINTDALRVKDLGISTAKLADNAVSDAKLRDSAALSVIGRASNSSGDPADIAAGTDGHVLRRSGTSLGFGLLVDANIASGAAIDAAKIHDGSVSNTEFGYLNGVTSAIQTQLDGKLTNTLTDGNIFVGNGSNVATSVNPSGDIDISNAGVFSINAGVIVNADINASAAIDATKLGNGDVDNTELSYLNGVTSAIQTQFDAKVTGPASATDEAIARFDGTTGKLVQNSTSSLTDSGALTIADIFKRGDGGLTDFIEEEYIHSTSLTASTTAVLSALTFNSQNYKAIEVEYMVNNSNDRRVGKLMVVCNNASGVNASAVSIVDSSTETADINLSWSAAINGSNIEISYTTSSGTYTIRMDVKRFKA